MQYFSIPEVGKSLVDTPAVDKAVPPNSQLGAEYKFMERRDSDEDDNIITMAQVNRTSKAKKPQPSQEVAHGEPLKARSYVRKPVEHLSSTAPYGAFRPCNLMRGEKVDIGLTLCPFKLVQSYPFRFVGRAKMDQVSEWFKANIFDGRIWDMYFIRDPYERRDPLVLVPLIQVSQLLRDINAELGFDLRIPGGPNGEMFELFFDESTCPRFMGKVERDTTYRTAKGTLGITIDDWSNLGDQKLQLFKEKMNKIYEFTRSFKSKKDPEKQRLKMMIRQKGWGQTIKRAQRYLGLREKLSLAQYSDKTDLGWDFTLKVPFQMESAVRFVCVDIEANELNTSTITEIGLAILDTEDIEDVPPGENGKNWLPFINAYHLRINEYRSIVNSRYVQGCPGSFNFGQSEFVDKKDVCHRLGELIGDANTRYKSNLVMVGHEAIADLKYLRLLGYNMWDLDEFLDEIDTKSMFQRLQCSTDGCGLEFVCRELGIPGHNFHNAGNDAMYTLRAMVAMAVGKKTGGPLTESEKAGWKPKVKLNEWSDGEQDDGGAPVKSAAPSGQTSAQQAQSTRDPFANQRW